jgi:hypothetical protein
MTSSAGWSMESEEERDRRHREALLRQAVAAAAHRARHQLCAGPHCTNRVPDKDYYTWLVPPAYNGGTFEPCCSRECGMNAYWERPTTRRVTSLG